MPNLPELGVGIVYVPGLEPLLESGDSPVDVLEIEPQTLWHYRPKNKPAYSFPSEAIQHLNTFPQRKIVHSIGFAVGGSQQPDSDFLSALATSVECLGAPWASEHLSFTSARGSQGHFHAGFMLPGAQTPEGIALAVRNIRTFAQYLPVPFAVETAVNYLQPRPGELRDGEYVARVVSEADCGILLDLHNIWTNEQNGRQRVDEFLSTIPLERVWEIHLGGGREYQGFWLDAHSGAVPKDVMALAKDVVPRLPNLKAIIFEIFPTFVPIVGVDVIGQELVNIQAIWRRRRQPNDEMGRDAPQGFIPTYVKETEEEGFATSPAIWERTLGELVTRGESAGPLADQLEKDPGVPLIRELVWKFRAGAIVNVLNWASTLIMLQCGDEFFEKQLDRYFKSTSPQPFASEEAGCFIQYLRTQDLDVPYLQETLDFEEAAMAALLTKEAQVIRARHNLHALLNALADGQVPHDLEEGSYEIEIPPNDEVTSNVKICT